MTVMGLKLNHMLRPM